MYYQPYPYYTRNTNQRQIPPCMMRGEEPAAVSPMQMESEEDMPEYQLEDMYPKTYDIIYPEVLRHCDKFDRDCCGMDIPSGEEIARMTDSITANTEAQIEASMNSGMREGEMRQLGYAGRGLLRDFVGVLLLRELFQRRHRPHRRRRKYPYYW